MPRRRILTERQRSALFDLPADEPVILHHYTLADDDIEHIRTRRHSRNRFGFALQLCAFIPTVIDQNPCAHLRMPRDMIFHGWSMRLFQAWQHSATMSS